jgi:acetolactate synthase-1/2/3 large subunit
MAELKTGAEIVWECLAREGVEVVFGYPGGAILHTYDALNKYSDRIHHVLVRHEQGATHMADGYAGPAAKLGWRSPHPDPAPPIWLRAWPPQ